MYLKKIVISRWMSSTAAISPEKKKRRGSKHRVKFYSFVTTIQEMMMMKMAAS